MIKILIAFLVWTGGFLLIMPSDKPAWMALLASIATFQVLLFFVEAGYRLMIDVLQLLEELSKGRKE